MTRFSRSSAPQSQRAASKSSEPPFLAVNDERIFLDFEGTVEKEPVWKAGPVRCLKKGRHVRRMPALRLVLVAGLALGILAAIGAFLFQPLHHATHSTLSPLPRNVEKAFNPPPRTTADGTFFFASERPGICWTFQTACLENPVPPPLVHKSDLHVEAKDSDALNGIVDACVRLCTDVRAHFAPNEKIPQPAMTDNRERKTGTASLEKVLDQLQSVEAQRKGCELALELMKNGSSVFSGFMPEPGGGGVDSLKVFQSKIAELEIKRKSLATRYMPQSKELRVINEEMSAVRETMRECLTEYISYLNRKKDYLTAAKLDLEGKTTSVAGRTDDAKGSPLGRPEPVPLPQLNPSFFPPQQPPHGSKKPFLTSARESADRVLCSVISSAKSYAVVAKNSMTTFLLSYGLGSSSPDHPGIRMDPPGSAEVPQTRTNESGDGESLRVAQTGTGRVAALWKKVTGQLPQFILGDSLTPDCTKQSLTMD